MSNNLPDSLFGIPIEYSDELKTPPIRLGEWEEQSAKALVEKTDDGFKATVAAIRFGDLSAYRQKLKYNAVVKAKGDGFDATCVEFPQLTAHGDTAEDAVRALATMLQDFVNE